MKIRKQNPPKSHLKYFSHLLTILDKKKSMEGWYGDEFDETLVVHGCAWADKEYPTKDWSKNGT
jgi:hypothetical protein